MTKGLHARPTAQRCCGHVVARAAEHLLRVAACMGLACGSEPELPNEVGIDLEREPPPAPAFVEPASGRLSVATTHTRDVVLRVTDVVRGQTGVLVDGVVVGALGRSAPLGTLDGDELRLRLRGALVPDTHRIILQTSTEQDGALRSEEVEIVVRESSAPELSATVADAQLEARIVAGWGRDVMGALGVDPQGGAVLTLVRLRDGGDSDGGGQWDWADAKTVAVAGYVAAPDGRGLAVGVDIVTEASGPDRLRVAWRAGYPGRTIQLLDVDWDDATTEAIATEAMDRAEAVTGPVEYAALGRPFVFGDIVLAELSAPTDTESPRPGDRAVLHARLSGTPAVAGVPQRVTFGRRQDLDMLGPVIDRAHAEVSEDALFSARLDGRDPVVVEIGADDGLLALRLVRSDTGGEIFAPTGTPLLTVVGAFGSRLVASTTATRAQFLQISDLSGRNPKPFSLTSPQLPDLEGLTGEPAVTTVAGAAVILFPYGTAAPVYAVTLTGAAPAITALTPLQCTSIAVPPQPADPDAQALPLACALDGQVLQARLMGVPPA